MTQGQFILLPQEDAQVDIQPAHLHFVCMQIVALFRQGKRIRVIAEDQEQAHRIDEHLWQFEADSFVAHHLAGEAANSPVEIAWLDNQTPGRFPVLVNAATRMPNNLKGYREVYDFVPFEESLKQLARERYKAYRQLGIALGTQNYQPAQQQA